MARLGPALLLLACLAQTHGSLLGAATMARPVAPRLSTPGLVAHTATAKKPAQTGAAISEDDMRTLAESMIRTAETSLIVFMALKVFGGGGRCKTCSHSHSCGKGSHAAHGKKAPKSLKGKTTEGSFSIKSLVSSIKVPAPPLDEGKRVFSVMWHLHRLAADVCKGTTDGLERALEITDSGLTVCGKSAVYVAKGTCSNALTLVKGSCSNALGLVCGAASNARRLVPSKKATFKAAKAAAILGLFYVIGTQIDVILSVIEAAGNIGVTSASFALHIAQISLGFMCSTAMTVAHFLCSTAVTAGQCSCNTATTVGHFTVKMGATTVGFVGNKGIQGTKVTLGTCKKVMKFGQMVAGKSARTAGDSVSCIVGGVSGLVGGAVGSVGGALSGISLPKLGSAPAPTSGSARSKAAPKPAPKPASKPAPKPAPKAVPKAASSSKKALPSLSIPVPALPDLDALKASPLAAHAMRSAETAAVLLIALRAFGNGSCESCSATYGCPACAKDGSSSSWWKWGSEKKVMEEKKGLQLPSIPKELETLLKIVAVVGLVAVADSKGIIPQRI